MDYNPEGLTLSILGCLIVRAKYFKKETVSKL